MIREDGERIAANIDLITDQSVHFLWSTELGCICSITHNNAPRVPEACGKSLEPGLWLAWKDSLHCYRRGSSRDVISGVGARKIGSAERSGARHASDAIAGSNRESGTSMSFGD